jgi:hypothetical protein
MRRLIKIALSPEQRARMRYIMDQITLNLRGPAPEIWSRPVFIHIPKAAGSSVLAAGAAYTKWHQPYSYYERFFRPDRRITLSFAVVRHPYDRFLSAFAYLRGGGMNGFDRGWAQRHMPEGIDAAAFARRLPDAPRLLSGMHFQPQMHFLRARDGSVGVDRILYFERLAEDWPEFARGAGLTPELPHVNRSLRPDDALSPEAMAALDRAYAEDFEALGYARGAGWQEAPFA